MCDTVGIKTHNNPRAITKRPQIPLKMLFHVTDTKSVNIIEDNKTALPINKLAADRPSIDYTCTSILGQNMAFRVTLSIAGTPQIGTRYHHVINTNTT